MNLERYITVVPGTIIRAYDFASDKFYIEGVVDGYYVSEDGTPYFYVEVSEDTTGENRDSLLVPIDLGESEWPDRIVQLGVEEDLLTD